MGDTHYRRRRPRTNKIAVLLRKCPANPGELQPATENTRDPMTSWTLTRSSMNTIPTGRCNDFSRSRRLTVFVSAVLVFSWKVKLFFFHNGSLFQYCHEIIFRVAVNCYKQSD